MWIHRVWIHSETRDMRTLCGYAEKEQADTVLLQSLNENKKAKKVVFERE